MDCINNNNSEGLGFRDVESASSLVQGENTKTNGEASSDTVFDRAPSKGKVVAEARRTKNVFSRIIARLSSSEEPHYVQPRKITKKEREQLTQMREKDEQKALRRQNNQKFNAELRRARLRLQKRRIEKGELPPLGPKPPYPESEYVTLTEVAPNMRSVQEVRRLHKEKLAMMGKGNMVVDGSEVRSYSSGSSLSLRGEVPYSSLNRENPIYDGSDPDWDSSNSELDMLTDSEGYTWVDPENYELAQRHIESINNVVD